MDVLAALMSFGAPVPPGEQPAAEEGFASALLTAFADTSPLEDGLEVPVEDDQAPVPPFATLALLLTASSGLVPWMPEAPSTPEASVEDASVDSDPAPEAGQDPLLLVDADPEDAPAAPVGAPSTSEEGAASAAQDEVDARDPAPNVPPVGDDGPSHHDAAPGAAQARRSSVVADAARVAGMPADQAPQASPAAASTFVPREASAAPEQPRPAVEGSASRPIGAPVAAAAADGSPSAPLAEVAQEPAGVTSREMVDRITEIVDRMSAPGSSRRMVVEAGELRLAVSLLGSAVSVTVVGGSDDGPDWSPQLAAALASRGLSLAADSGSSGRGRDDAPGRQHPDEPVLIPGRRRSPRPGPGGAVRL